VWVAGAWHRPRWGPPGGRGAPAPRVRDLWSGPDHEGVLVGGSPQDDAASPPVQDHALPNLLKNPERFLQGSPVRSAMPDKGVLGT